MSRRLFAATAIVIWSLAPGLTRDARAQDRSTDAVPNPLFFTSAALGAVATPAVAVPDAVSTDVVRPSRGGRSALLGSLYASTAVLQALDVHSTLSGIRNGATEGNPLMASVTSNKSVFIATKAGVAALTIYAVSKLAKRNKVAAIATLIGINSAYGLIVSRNYQIARQLR